jgi:hypothetical protein
VIGIIEGSEEPDSWVMLGNHFDAWVFGSLDPNSGTAILAEIGRAFAETIRKSGWRPKRTLVFCAWDAEEHGLIGFGIVNKLNIFIFKGRLNSFKNSLNCFGTGQLSI